MEAVFEGWGSGSPSSNLWPWDEFLMFPRPQRPCDELGTIAVEEGDCDNT